MTKEQNKAEYEKCKAKGLLGRLAIKILKEYGTEEEIAARNPGPDTSPSEEEKEKKPIRKKKK